jgi:hypothetical protein
MIKDIMNKAVDDYINKQKSPQREILKEVRRIILSTLPNCSEETKWGVVAFAGGKFYISALKNSVNVGFAINGLNKEEIGLFKGSGKTMRHIKIQSLADIEGRKLVELVKMVDKKAICDSC